MTTKIYIASSWKNAELCRKLARLFRLEGIDVYCFSEDHACNFKWDELPKGKYDIRSVLCCSQTRVAFETDRRGLDWANCVVLVLPSGRSAHLEAGYTKGQGKTLFIYASNGLDDENFENMYHWADRIFDDHELPDLVKAMRGI
jgi:nucleoside 2-deoxyribosyltransferase